MKITNVTIGADPELFLINKDTKKVVSSIDIIPGEKGNPYRSKDMPEGYGLETDNILAEFNIPPVTSRESFVNNINYMKNYIKEYIKDKNLDILCASSKIVDYDQLQSPQAKLFGCDVDYNAYTESPNPKPKGELTNLRSAGFHIHIGYKNKNISTSLLLVKYLDLFLGLPSIIIDKDTKRRTLYGKAGCFRLTPYGVEYRVLSSYMMSTDLLIAWVYDQVFEAINNFNVQTPLPDLELIRNTINNSNVSKALEICNNYNIFVPCVEYLES